MPDYHTDNAVFIVYKDWETLFDSLDTNEEAGALIKALFAFAKRGEVAEFSGALKMAFIVMSQQLEKDGVKWEEKCERNAINGAKGGRPKKQTEPTETEKSEWFFEEPKKAYKEKEKEKEKDKDNNIYGVDKPTPKRFIKPTLEEIKTYCRERNNKVNADKFFNYYESNGWKVGKNPMKDWKAAVRTWEKNNFDNNASNKEESDFSKYDFVINAIP